MDKALLDRLASLPRTRTARALLARALEQLDARHELGRKVARSMAEISRARASSTTASISASRARSTF
jgi:hypothetical protein